MKLEIHDNQEYIHTGMGLFPSEKNDAEQELAVLDERIEALQCDLIGLHSSEMFLITRASDNQDEAWHYASSFAYNKALDLVQKHLIDIKV